MLPLNHSTYHLWICTSEYLTQGVKNNAAGRWRPRTQRKMMDNLRSYLRSTQKCQDVVRRFFHAEPVRYAAA